MQERASMPVPGDAADLPRSYSAGSGPQRSMR